MAFICAELGLGDFTLAGSFKKSTEFIGYLELFERKTFSALCSSEFDLDSRLERTIILENLKTFEENFFRLAIFSWILEKLCFEVVTLS